jgi:hypothetical protein
MSTNQTSFTWNRNIFWIGSSRVEQMPSAANVIFFRFILDGIVDGIDIHLANRAACIG